MSVEIGITRIYNSFISRYIFIRLESGQYLTIYHPGTKTWPLQAMNRVGVAINIGCTTLLLISRIATRHGQLLPRHNHWALYITSIHNGAGNGEIVDCSIVKGMGMVWSVKKPWRRRRRWKCEVNLLTLRIIQMSRETVKLQSAKTISALIVHCRSAKSLKNNKIC